MPLTRRAFLLVRNETARAAIAAGLARLGYTIKRGYGVDATPADLLVTWNRYGSGENCAVQAEKRGCPVVVAENGYVGRGTIALALDHHVGAGRWPSGTAAQFRRFGVPTKPWRRGGEAILVCPQRGIGPAGVAMPARWGEDTAERLSAMTERPVILRRHPGQGGGAEAGQPPLEAQLEQAWAVAVWASRAGIDAMLAGVPVFHDFPRWIGAPGALPLPGSATAEADVDLEKPYRGSREPLKKALARAQWSIDEIASGEAFRCLLAL